MNKISLTLAQFIALVLTYLALEEVLHIPIDKDHGAAVTGTAIVVFSLTNFALIGARYLLSRLGRNG